MPEAPWVPGMPHPLTSPTLNPQPLMLTCPLDCPDPLTLNPQAHLSRLELSFPTVACLRALGAEGVTRSHFDTYELLSPALTYLP